MPNKESVLDMMNASDAVYLSTICDGEPRIRAMVNLRRIDLYPGTGEFCRQEGFTCYFDTSLSSSKVRSLASGSLAAAYYCVPSQIHGVEIRGTLEILDDPELKRILWQDQWRIYWPNGPSDPDYVVLRLTAREANGWWGSEPFWLELGSE